MTQKALLIVSINFLLAVTLINPSKAQWVTSGTSIYSNNTGNVGIGTKAPVTKLHIIGPSGSSGETFVNTMDGMLVENAGSSNNYCVFQTATKGGGKSFSITNAGRVGIGTTSPAQKLHIINSAANSVIRLQGKGDNVASYLDVYSGNNNSGLWKYGVGGIELATKGILRMVVDENGNVGIGTKTPKSTLAVNGKITAKEVEVTMDGWADYVFKNDYTLKPLAEVEKFIQENKHLPEVPSEKEVKEKGNNLGKMDAVLLQKIEELTLYIIEQNKAIQQQSKSIETLKAENTNLAKRIILLEKN